MVKEANGWKIYLKKTKEEGFNEGIALSQKEVEAANLKAEKERQKAEEERQKAEETNIKAVLGFVQNTHFKDAQIADILNLPIEYVEAIRNEHATK